MNIVGLWDGHNASAAVVCNGTLRSAISEERISRSKFQRGFPLSALDIALEAAGLTLDDVDLVACCGRYGRAPMRLFDRRYSVQSRSKGPTHIQQRFFRHYENLVSFVPGFRRVEEKVGFNALRRRLEAAGIKSGIPLHICPHHTGHAFGAASMARNEALVVTMDGYGDGLWATVSHWGGDEPRLLKRRRYMDSIAVTYGSVCQLLGFREGDEGKVTALAAHGDPVPLYSFFHRRLNDSPLVRGGPLLPYELAKLRKYKPVDIAAALQSTVEDWIIEFLTPYTQDAPDAEICVSGGLFANVKVNSRLAQHFNPRPIRVFPAMDDTGLSVGAALHAWYARTGLISQFKDPFLGPSLYLSPSVLNEATGFNILSQDDKSNIEASVKVLAKDGTVAIVRGRDEFGPRALGHRSLLFSARSNLLANRVQKLLGRDSVMPFAPICRAEQVDSLFEGPFPIPERADRGLTHMTFAVTARPETRDRYPVAVHVDDSSRVQAVTAEKSPFLHTLLTRYEELTGDKMLINTSFNLHGDPIVHDARDALQTFAQSGIDLLVLGDYLVTRDIVQ